MGLKVGDKAPELLGVNENGEEIRLSSYKGKKVVLYFYPKDNTSGCTAQACSLRDNYSELRKAGYEVIGVSVDDEKSHQKFIAKNMYSEVMIWRMGMNFVSRIMYRGRHRWMTCLTGVMKA